MSARGVMLRVPRYLGTQNKHVLVIGGTIGIACIPVACAITWAAFHSDKGYNTPRGSRIWHPNVLRPIYLRIRNSAAGIPTKEKPVRNLSIYRALLYPVFGVFRRQIYNTFPYIPSHLRSPALCEGSRPTFYIGFSPVWNVIIAPVDGGI